MQIKIILLDLLRFLFYICKHQDTNKIVRYLFVGRKFSTILWTYTKTQL